MQGNTQRLHGGAVAASGNTRSYPIKCRFSSEAIFFLDVTAISGTLDVEIQTYNRLADKWHRLAVFDQKSATGQDEGYVEYGIGEKLAISYTVSDTATFTVDVHLK
jgi:hypothetical protein